MVVEKMLIEQVLVEQMLQTQLTQMSVLRAKAGWTDAASTNVTIHW